MEEKLACIVLAAGKGTRLKCRDIPKVMLELESKPMIDYSIRNLNKAGFKKPIVVVGFQGQKVIDFLKDRATYAWQKKRLGTANAVLSAKEKVSSKVKTILVVGGDDSAFYKPQTLKDLVKNHQKYKADMTLLTVEVSDPTGLGRILKDKSGQVKEIVEEKLASKKIKKIKEVNTGCYVFETDFLWEGLKMVKKNPTGEYFITDLVAIGNVLKKRIITFKAQQKEWFGINTLEQLEEARSRIRELF